jgi:HEAT repeat protein
LKFAIDEVDEKLTYSQVLELLQGNRKDKERGIEALGMMGGRRAISKLISVLEKEDYVTRLKAVEALSQVGKGAVPILIETLEKGLWYVRECAALALGKIGDLRALEPLAHRLEDENVGVRQAAASALTKLFSSDNLAKLLQGMEPEGITRIVDLASRLDPQLGERVRGTISQDKGPGEDKLLKSFRKEVKGASLRDEERRD